MSTNMLNLLKKLTGYQHHYHNSSSHRFKWGEVAVWTKNLGLRWQGPHYSYSPKLIIEAFFFNVYIPTSSFGVSTGGYDIKDTMYGCYLYPSLAKWQDTCFHWGTKSWRWYMPWTYTWESTEHLSSDGKTIVSDSAKSKRDWMVYRQEVEEYQKTHSRVLDYTYTLRNGTIQNRKATVSIERRTWKMRGWPWKKHVRTSIEVSFDQEVGEQSGSWKGGVIGTNHDMLPNETVEQALRRMESERKFT